MGIDEVGIDKVRIDKVRIDKVGITLVTKGLRRTSVDQVCCCR